MDSLHEPLDRRGFLGAMTAVGGAFALPGWMAPWFTPQDPATTAVANEREKQLRAAAQVSKEQGKPLLVFVVPPNVDSREAVDRSRWFGSWFDHGGWLALLEIALCVPACGTIEAVRNVTGAAPIDGEPLLLVIDVSRLGERDAPPPRVTPIAVELPAFANRRLNAVEKREEEKLVHEGLEKLTAELHRGLHRHGATAEKLVVDVRAKMDAAQRKALATWLADGVYPGDELLVRATAEVRSHAVTRDDKARKRLLEALQGAAKRQIADKNLPGSKWETTSCPSCGMGHVPVLCDRFLDFWIGS